MDRRVVYILLGIVVLLCLVYTTRSHEYLGPLKPNVTPLAHSEEDIVTSTASGDIQLVPASHFVNGILDRTVPLGTIVMSLLEGPVNEPKEYGWYYCNGQPIPLDDKTSEFSQKMGSLIPLREGRLHLPDMMDRFPVGSGREYENNDKGGSARVSLRHDEMPKHKHKIEVDSSLNKTLVRKKSDGYEKTSGKLDVDMGSGENTDEKPESFAHKHTATASEEGKGKAHENRPPYYAVSFLIKVHY